MTSSHGQALADPRLLAYALDLLENAFAFLVDDAAINREASPFRPWSGMVKANAGESLGNEVSMRQVTLLSMICSPCTLAHCLP